MFTLFLDQLNAWNGFICPVHGRVEALKNSGLCRNQPKNVDLVSEKKICRFRVFYPSQRHNPALARVSVWRLCDVWRFYE